VPGPKPEAEQEVVSPAGAPPSSAGPDVEPGAGVEPEVVDAAELEVVDDAEPVPQAEPVDLADKYLDLAQRTQADFDNYRKRMTREVRAAEARGIGKLAKELLPALDNLARALAAVESSDGPEHQLSQGFRLVAAELSAALGRTGIQGYDPTGERFDPVQHEAVAQQPFEGAESGTVVQVLQPGYRLNEAILRPAKVIVAS
jgi:molecular chaperone GrpE